MSQVIEFIEYEKVIVRKYMTVEISNDDFQLLKKESVYIDSIADKYYETIECYHRRDGGGSFECYGGWKLA